jgi:hypothetical protein
MAEPEKWTLTLNKPDRYGREQVRTVNLFIDIRDFKERAGFAWLLLAANPHLSIADIQEVLSNVGEQHERPVGWIVRRRWLFRDERKAGARRNADGLDESAHRIMNKNPKLSNRKMARVLRDNGIPRSPEWVRQNRTAN